MGLGWVSLCGGDECGASSSQGESTLPRSVLGRIHRRSGLRPRGLGSMCRSIPLSANTHDNTVGYGDARQGDPQHGTRPSSVYNDCEAVGFTSSLKVQSSPMKYSDAPLRVFRVLAMGLRVLQDMSRRQKGGCFCPLVWMFRVGWPAFHKH